MCGRPACIATDRPDLSISAQLGVSSRRKSFGWRFLEVLCSFCLATSAVYADSAAVTFSSGTPGTWSTGTSGNVGFHFTDISPAAVTSLGVYDFGSDGLLAAHEVGLWDSNGVLLASVTVPAGTAATLQSGFRYVPLTAPIFLVPTAAYDIGAFFGSDDSQAIRVMAFSTDSSIQYQWADITGGPSFAEPHGSPGSIYEPGIFGPSFLLRAVPEPNTIPMLIFGGLLSLGFFAVTKRYL